MLAGPKVASVWQSEHRVKLPDPRLATVPFGMANVSAAKQRVGRIVQSVDFQRVLGVRSCAQSNHFAVHHLSESPAMAARGRVAPEPAELSTCHAKERPAAVDNMTEAEPMDCTVWLGCVVPKRHAKRSVTRSMMKRQVRHALRDQQATEDPLAPGLWVVRLRASFDPQKFVSANSSALQSSVAVEVRTVLAQAARRFAPQRVTA